LAKYAANVALIEFDAASLPVSEALIYSLQQLPWAVTVTVDGSSLRLTTDDLDTAKRELLDAVTGHGVILNRYEWVRPTLEDIFLTISA
jgi:ABC-type uncharacterized transport system ATPase subunit